MNDDFVSLRLLVASDVVARRNLWRQGAALASMPIEVIEHESSPDAARALAGGADILVVESTLAGGTDLVKAAREAAPSPIVLSVLVDGAGRLNGSDGVAPSPLNADQARDIVDRCIRARMPMRAMVVDDSGTMRAIVRKILAASRFIMEISEADDGQAALQRIKSGAVDMVFLDYNMPGLNGLDTLAEIRRERPGVSVVMMTATLDENVAAQARAVGAGFLKKPFYPKDIDDLLEKHYGLHST